MGKLRHVKEPRRLRYTRREGLGPFAGRERPCVRSAEGCGNGRWARTSLGAGCYFPVCRGSPRSRTLGACMPTKG